MIEKLQNRDVQIAKAIRSVFQLSYKVEADLLNVSDFPPLRRPLENYVNSKTEFFGFIKDGELAGVIEVERESRFTSINSLVIHPNFFRQGIAKALLEFTFSKFQSKPFVVETGLENIPAIELYKKLGFKEVKQWDTDFGIRKIQFERHIN